MIQSTLSEDFLLTQLQAGEIQSIQWSDTEEIVTKNAYRIGLKPHLRESLLEYCDCMGITHMLMGMMEDKQREQSDDDKMIRLQGKEWFIQRSPSTTAWYSNMHWLSPRDDIAYQHFLRALSEAGFDEILQSIGKYFGFQGLVAYHLSIIAVSRCNHGTIHVDATNTGVKVMNVIIPLILASETGAELNLRDDQVLDVSTGGKKVGRLRYQYDVAALVGDDAYHSTSAVDYTHLQSGPKMRMAATAYIGDISDSNIEAALDDYITYSGQYPPPSQPDILLQSAGAHWQHDDPSKKLPFKPKR